MKFRFFRKILLKMCVLSLGLTGLFGVLYKPTVAVSVQSGSCAKDMFYKVFAGHVDGDTIKYRIVFENKTIGQKKNENKASFVAADLGNDKFIAKIFYNRKREKKLAVTKPVIKKSSNCLEFEINKNDLEFDGAEMLDVAVEIYDVALDEASQQEKEKELVVKVCTVLSDCLGRLKELREDCYVKMPSGEITDAEAKFCLQEYVKEPDDKTTTDDKANSCLQEEHVIKPRKVFGIFAPTDADEIHCLVKVHEASDGKGCVGDSIKDGGKPTYGGLDLSDLIKPSNLGELDSVKLKIFNSADEQHLLGEVVGQVQKDDKEICLDFALVDDNGAGLVEASKSYTMQICNKDDECVGIITHKFDSQNS